MRRTPSGRSVVRLPRAAWLLSALVVASLHAACDRRGGGGVADPDPRDDDGVAGVRCTANVVHATLACVPPVGALPHAGRGTVTIGDTGVSLLVEIRGVCLEDGCDPAVPAGIFQAEVTVRNPTPLAVGTADGRSADGKGVRVFFHHGPVVIETSDGRPGTVAVHNADGVDTFTASGQPYFRYDVASRRPGRQSVLGSGAGCPRSLPGRPPPRGGARDPRPIFVARRAEPRPLENRPPASHSPPRGVSIPAPEPWHLEPNPWIPMTTHASRTIRAPRGPERTCKGWTQEAALRMLMNNLDPEVAERPEDLVVYGGTGKAARSWEAFDAIVRTLRELEDDETLLVQSGKPVAVFRTHRWAPRVLIANSNLVPEWATWPEFRRLDALGLTMYGQMTAGSWIYIGTQGILQGTYETFAAVAAKRFGGSLAGTLTVTAGLGGMGGAQPLAITMNGGVALVVEVNPARAQRRVETRYLDVIADDLDDAIARAEAAKRERKPLSVGVIGNAAEVLPELLRRNVEVDVVTDQTSAHDPLSYLPKGVALEDWDDYAAAKPDEFTDRARESMAEHVDAMVGFLDRGAEVFDYGNSLRSEAELGGAERAFDYPGFVPAYIRPLFCQGKGPFRWAALSGDPADIAATDRAILELFGENEALTRWIRLAGERVAFQGLPARICWLGYGERHLAGLRFNEMVASGELAAPIVIGRDHLDCGSVASPYRETEAMADGSDAIADWPLLNALVNTASGATWVSIHHGGGVGIGRSIHAGQVTVADGTELAAQKLERVLTNDPGMGVVRHVDAGYPEAKQVAAERGVRVPMA